MIVKFFILLYIPIVVNAYIAVKIKIPSGSGNVTTSSKGAEYQHPTEDDISAMKLNDQNVKEAIKKFTGTAPDEVFLTPSSEWEKPCQTIHWDDIQKKLKMISKKTITMSSSSKTVTVSTKKIKNDNNEDMVLNDAVTADVQNQIDFTWEKSEISMIKAVVVLYFNFPNNKNKQVRGEWGKPGNISVDVQISSKPETSVTLAPKETATATVSAVLTDFKVQLPFHVTADGFCAAHYIKPHRGLKYWLYNATELELPVSKRNLIVSVTSYDDGKVSIVKD